jgi:DNA polymerase III epsilon subunit-like protein
MTDVMMDLETLSVRPNAVILVIGAIKFKRGETWPEKITEKDLKKLDTFYIRIKIDSCKNIGLHVDKETQKWWSIQDSDVRYEALENKDRVTIGEALRKFKQWFGTNPRTKIWGNGSSFDCTILGEAYKRCGMKVPWKFWLERDLRTIMDLGEVRACDLPQYKKHNALYDCYRQILGFQRSEKNLGL